ncbi:MAG: hypothetical protein HY897_24660 [Deltaproteobacteria bacterium]|nr:hypothetical protein [Deltaproteobacteria bacterium]
MALIITRAKRTIGAFIFSLLLYIFPSLGGGCNVADEKDGGAEMSDVSPGGDDAVLADGSTSPDGGSEDFGNTCGAYGPPPCESDEDCAAYGDGYYCDKDHQINMCGETTTWPTCKGGVVTSDAGPQDAGYEDYGNTCAAYGPRPCDTDQDCRDWNDAGNWVCDKDHVAGYCNGEPMTWPTCIETADADAGYADFGTPCAAYGPQPAPCETDAECVAQNGAGWYCDKDFVIDVCGTLTTQPTCVPGGDK